MRYALAGMGLFLFFSYATLSSATEPAALSKATPNLEEACKTVYTDCRANYTVQFRLKDGSEYKQTFALTYPPVQNDTFVTIFPGESLRLEATVEGDRITKLKPATPTADPARTISLELKQMDGKAGMMLLMTNPFPQPLKYRAGIHVPDLDGLRKTSSCSVLAGKSGFESWPYPLFEMVLTDFRLLPDEQMVCD